MFPIDAERSTSICNFFLNQETRITREFSKPDKEHLQNKASEKHHN